ncbi:MAG TPA: hypothetical protein GXX15_02825 [Clostridia bacterium]|nr:hypothetical protein [Clostridia bacterium]
MLYTIIPYELIFEKREDIPTNFIELKMGNKQLVVEKLSNGNYIIQRMYSTNPFDYLDINYSPGSIISIF